MNIRLAFSILALALSGVATAYSNPKDFVGKYAYESGGEPRVQITAKGDNLLVSIVTSSGWSTPEKCSPISDARLKELLGDDAKTQVHEGFETGEIGDTVRFSIFHVTKDNPWTKEVPGADYLVMHLFPQATFKLP
jgi:hypothetical protein